MYLDTFADKMYGSPEFRINQIMLDVDTMKSTIVSGSFEYRSYVTLKAPDAEPGKKFAYWKDDTTDAILAYSQVYGFYCYRDVAPTPIYVNESEEIERTAHSYIHLAKPLEGKVYFMVERCVPPGFTVVSHGIILTMNPDIGPDPDAFVIGAEGNIQGTASTKTLIGIYAAPKSANSGETWYGRGFVIYKDEDNVEHTVYSNIASGTAL